MASEHLDTVQHPISEAAYRQQCRDELTQAGALVLRQFVRATSIAQIVEQSAPRESQAFYADGTHNVFLTPSDPALADDHPFNRQVRSTKGLIADDQIPADSPLRQVYGDPDFRSFLAAILDIDEIHPYDDSLSSINVHFASEGRELGWHFDNSSFAVTMLLQAPQAGGHFEYVPEVRPEVAETAAGYPESVFETVTDVLEGHAPVRELQFDPGDLVLFRGRNALHRVTSTEGQTTRLLVVFAFNDAPGVALSDSALQTFYGRTE